MASGVDLNPLITLYLPAKQARVIIQHLVFIVSILNKNNHICPVNALYLKHQKCCFVGDHFTVSALEIMIKKKPDNLNQTLYSLILLANIIVKQMC